MKQILVTFFIILIAISVIQADSGKKVFETYCWGCHHQSAMAFGPSFTQIAGQRTAQEIKAMITDPEAVSKVLGYKRNAMPALKLTAEELKAVTAYILSFKHEADQNTTKEHNKTIIKEPYPNIARVKEKQ